MHVEKFNIVSAAALHTPLPQRVINCRASHRPSAAAMLPITDTNAGGRRGSFGPIGDIGAPVREENPSTTAVIAGGLLRST